MRGRTASYGSLMLPAATVPTEAICTKEGGKPDLRCVERLQGTVSVFSSCKIISRSGDVRICADAFGWLSWLASGAAGERC